MKILNTKLVLSALGIALLATPAFAQKSQHHSKHQAVQQQSESVQNQGAVPSSDLYGGSFGE